MAEPLPSSAPSPLKPAILLRGPVGIDEEGTVERFLCLVPRPDTYQGACKEALRLFPSLKTELVEECLASPLRRSENGLGLTVKLFEDRDIYVTAEAWDTAPLVNVPLDKPLIFDVDLCAAPFLERYSLEDLGVSTSDASLSESAGPLAEEASEDEELEQEEELNPSEPEDFEEVDAAILTPFDVRGEEQGNAESEVIREDQDQVLEEDTEEEDLQSEGASLAPPPTPPLDEPVPLPRPGDRMLHFELELFLPPNGQVCDLLAEVEDRLSLDVSTSFDKYRLKAGPRTLNWDDRLDSVSPPTPDLPRSIHLHKNGSQVEPACHLLTPFELPTVLVTILAVEGGFFERTYPRRPILTHDGWRSVSWHVTAKPHGRLAEVEGRGISGIFWEVMDRQRKFSGRYLDVEGGLRLRDDSPPFQRSLSLTPSNACLIPLSNFVAHITSLLELFPLTPAMRSAFIDYIKYTVKIWDLFSRPGTIFVAFRFASQDNLSEALDLRIHPEPDVIARIFLIFAQIARGSPEQRWNWRKPGRVDWVEQSGIDVQRAEDEELFRVIEWGAMEGVY
ncbi:hypothetical protein JCM11251_000851 [Rhodosporidiobolus azoricus]